MGKDVRWKQRFQNFGKALAFLRSGVEKQASLALHSIKDRYFPVLKALEDQLKTK